MTGKNPEYEVNRNEGRVKEGEVLDRAHRDRSEDASGGKDILKRTSGEDVSSAGEDSVRSHTGGKSVRSPDTINAYRAREPRAESGQTVDTINAYRSREPGLESPYWADTEDEP
jgi:hypothetical protein